MEGTPGCYLVQSPAQAGPPGSSCLGPHLGGFGISSKGRLCYLSGHVLVLCHLHSVKAFPDVEMDPSLFVSLASSPVTEHH